MDKKTLLSNIEKVHTTRLGLERISRNLQITPKDVIEYCKNALLSEDCIIYRKGKNYCCEIDNMKITINAYSYTIITGHKLK